MNISSLKSRLPVMSVTLKRQRGVASLLLSLVILTLITFVTLFTAKTVTLEQKIAANSLQGRQAFEAAEAGMEAAISYATPENGGIDRVDNSDGSAGADELADTNIFDGSGLVDVDDTDANTNVNSLTDGGQVTVTISGDADDFTVTSVGQNADRSASRTIVQTIALLNVIPEVPQQPLTAVGSVGIGGSASIYNPEGNLTIVTGDSVDPAGTGTLKTAIKNPSPTASCLDPPDAYVCETVDVSTGSSLGLDVIENSSTLKNMTTEEFFEFIFGMPMDEFKSIWVDREINGSDYDAELDDTFGEVVWVNGNASTTSGVNVGCNGGNGNKVSYSSVFCTDANLEPSIIIIDGDYSDSGSKITGLVFVTGTITFTGNATYEGAIAAAGGTTSSTGSLDIWYSTKVLEALNDGGEASPAAGTWRDFSN